MIIKNSDNWRDHEHWWEVERWKSRERGRGGENFRYRSQNAVMQSISRNVDE